jgi:hypothetical protein
MLIVVHYKVTCFQHSGTGVEGSYSLLCGTFGYQLNTGRTSVRKKVFFSARFYCELLTLHVSAPFSGHLQVVRKHKKIYPTQSLYIQRIR